MADDSQIQQVLGRNGSEGNLYMWGKLYVYRPALTVAGWLVDSWSINGSPYWQPEVHWLDKKEDKVWRIQMNLNLGRRAMNIHGADKEIDPARAKFIRATVERWEKEWYDDGAKLPGS